MLDDTQMLSDIRKNVQMGCQGIDEVLEYVTNEDFRAALRTQREEYSEIFHEADEMLRTIGAEPEDIPMMSKISSKTMTMMKTMADSSTEHLAEMMYQGSAMGVTKAIHNSREYSGKNTKINDLSDKIVKTEERNMEEMKKFL